MSKNIEYEFYFMSGTPINLKEKGLGVIYQPRLKDFLNKDIGVLQFSHPFLFTKEMILNKKSAVDELVQGLGRLGFLIVYSEITSIASVENDFNILELLIESLKLLYKTDNVVMAKTIGKVIVDNKIVIGDLEFEFLSNLVLEMLRLDKKDLNINTQDNKQEDELLNEFEKRAKKYEENKKDKKESSLMDIVNVVVHSQGVIDYDKAFNMTIYQLRNSYETIIKKEVYNVNLAHRISPNFKPSEDFKIWEENANVVKSNLI